MYKHRKSLSKTRKKRFNLLLTEEEIQFLKELSRIEKKPIAEILRNSVEYLYYPSSQLLQKEFLEKIVETEYLSKEIFKKYQKDFLHYEKNNFTG